MGEYELNKIYAFFADFNYHNGRIKIGEGVYTTNLKLTVKSLIFQLKNTKPSKGRKPYEELLIKIYKIYEKTI